MRGPPHPARILSQVSTTLKTLTGLIDAPSQGCVLGLCSSRKGTDQGRAYWAQQLCHNTNRTVCRNTAHQVLMKLLESTHWRGVPVTGGVIPPNTGVRRQFSRQGVCCLAGWAEFKYPAPTQKLPALGAWGAETGISEANWSVSLASQVRTGVYR